MIRPLASVITLGRALRPQPKSPRPELAVLGNWWCSAPEEQAAREVETRLFFDPALVRECRSLQQRLHSSKRLLAAVVLGVTMSVAPLALAQAEETSSGEAGQAEADDGGSLWDWFAELFDMQTTNDGESSGSEDPETGE